jgi:penicillin-binding protein 1A
VGLHLPPIQSLEIPKRPPSIQINSLDGRLFATRGEMGGAALPLKDMPAHLPNAPVGLFRAVVANLLHRGISQGGSTITQQLAKNLFLTQDRNLMRKMQEVVLAMWLELHQPGFPRRLVCRLHRPARHRRVARQR